MRIFILLMLFATLLRQCSSGRETLEGRLSMYGAEPFVQLAVMTDDNERVFLDGEPELLDRLWKENKGRIKIEGERYEDEWYGQSHPFIKVEEWEWI
ncbi:MAG: hypothetical protein WD266_13385 [Balneolales bacterium]